MILDDKYGLGVICGSANSGKTSYLLKLCVEKFLEGKRCMFMTSELTFKEFREKTKHFLNKKDDKNAGIILYRNVLIVNSNSNEFDLAEEVAKHKINFIAIDGIGDACNNFISLSSLKNFFKKKLIVEIKKKKIIKRFNSQRYKKVLKDNIFDLKNLSFIQNIQIIFTLQNCKDLKNESNKIKLSNNSKEGIINYVSDFILYVEKQENNIVVKTIKDRFKPVNSEHIYELNP